jgi:hypothetical protein
MSRGDLLALGLELRVGTLIGVAFVFFYEHLFVIELILERGQLLGREI